MTRLLSAAAALILPAFCQSFHALPAFQWIKEVDSSGMDTFVGLGVDAVGNTYIAGATSSAAFPVKAAQQSQIASSGLYRIDGPGSAYVTLGLASAYAVVVDPQSPNTIYAASNGIVVKSTSGGVTFTNLSLPSSSISVLAISPATEILYAATYDQGLFKSADGGVTWTSSNGNIQGIRNQIEFQGLWIDPAEPNVMLANAVGNFIRSSDGGASWQIILLDTDILNVSFDTANPGVVYAETNLGAASKSTDHGQSFSVLATPTTFGEILPDPNHSGRLVASTSNAILESDDGGSTWTSKLALPFIGNVTLFTADWANGFLYIPSSSSAYRITSDLQTITPVGPPAMGFISGITAANGHAYVANGGSHDVYVTKLDPLGNVVYSTYFGGSADDVGAAMAVDPTGNVYVTGTTTSLDFPVTKGAYASSGGSFLFKLNPDGSTGYSTYFAPSGNSPIAIAVDAGGSAYLSGGSFGNLPVTPGAYQTDCNCPSIPAFFLTIFQVAGFATKFDSTGSSLLYSTYIAGTAEFESPVSAFAIGPDGTAYVGGLNGIFHLNAAGSTLLGSLPSSMITAKELAVAPDANLYVVSSANSFPATAGAFEPTFPGPPQVPGQSSLFPTVVAEWDPQLVNLLAATYFAGASPNDLTFDSAGNLYLAGVTGQQGLPTRTPLQAGFAATTGFLSELSGDLSTLLFSSYFGDAEPFALQGVAVRKDGSVVIGGSTTPPNTGAGPMNIYLNSLIVAPPQPLRIDAVENAASMLDGPISAGETIVVRGAGFATSAQLLLGDTSVSTLSITPTAITAVVPEGLSGSTTFQVSSSNAQSGNGTSNLVLVPVAVTSPGIFSQDGSGYGPGYILNKDGTLNSPANPALPGDRITIFATGVGPVSFTNGFAVTQSLVNVFVDGFYADGVAAVMGPVQGLPGSVYQITVYVPNPASQAATDPNLNGFKFPNPVGVTMQINGPYSQNGIELSISN